MCDECEWEWWRDFLNGIMPDEDFQFAYDFLSSVHDYVIVNEHITDKQKTAISNISKSATSDPDGDPNERARWH